MRLSEIQSVSSIYPCTKIGTISIEHKPLMNKKWLLNSVTQLIHTDRFVNTILFHC